MDEKLLLIEELADNFDAEYRPHYSGRFMYGDTCPGIVTDSPNQVMEKAAAVGIKGACTDSMGLKTIVYWPSISTKRQES